MVNVKCLFQCASQELGDSLFKVNPNAALSTLPQLLEAMRFLAVTPSLPDSCVPNCSTYTARVREKTETTCAFRAKCECRETTLFGTFSLTGSQIQTIFLQKEFLAFAKKCGSLAVQDSDSIKYFAIIIFRNETLQLPVY